MERIIMKRFKLPYEDPEFLKIDVLEDILTFSGYETLPEDPDDGDDDWGMGGNPL